MLENLEPLVALAKRRGFVFPGSEIYGGLANTYDYGPLGAEVIRNIKNLWWQRFVSRRDDIFGVDTGILMNAKVWQASGHTQEFTDPLVECMKCHKRFRRDMVEAVHNKVRKKVTPRPVNISLGEGENEVLICEAGGQHEFTEPKKFNLMFKTHVGATEEKGSLTYLRPETAQGMFVNFKNVLTTQRPKLPFGLAQIGKGFRNEITLGNFIFRTLEFDMMEIEYFLEPKEWKKHFELWKKEMWQWLLDLGVSHKNLRWREHGQEERSHYSERTEDVEYKFPFGWGELYGLAYRTDYDLRNHSEKSGEDLRFHPAEGKPFFPHVVEPTFGVSRTLFVALLDGYHEEKVKGEKRVVLKLNPVLAPYKVAVFPLLSNKKDLVEKARKVYQMLLPLLPTVWDDRGNIGKRYFSQDEIGTPWCVTIDHQTLKDDTVTIRDRDSMKQVREKIEKLGSYFIAKLQSK